jgi:hypothetical protein
VRRAATLPALIALAPVELADQQQPSTHTRVEVGRAFTDLYFKMLEGNLDRCHDLLRHATQYSEHTFDLLSFQRISLSSEKCVRAPESAADPCR